MKRFFLRFAGRWLPCLPLLLVFGCSSFELASEPPAAIYENGEMIGATPYRFSLVGGARTFSLRRVGYVEEEVFVSSLDPRQRTVQLQWVGRTRIDSLPRGAKVLAADGAEELGTTPCGLHLARPVRVLVKKEGFEPVERDLVPNRSYVVELKPLAGFKSAFYREITFTSSQGPVAIHDRVAGERIGTTPARLNIEAGSALEYRLPGYQPRFALISRNEPLRIDIELEPLARVTIEGPPGAEVYRAGGVEKIGTVPHTVVVDRYEVFEIKKEGHYGKTLAVSSTSPPLLRVDLEKLPYKTIVTDPEGAEVYRLGGIEKLGEAPYTTLVEGERVFEIKKKGFKPYVMGLGPGSPERTSVPLAPLPRDDPDAAAIGSLDNPAVDSF